nr:unnamed protein product [Callosobruchus chinensis]
MVAATSVGSKNDPSTRSRLTIVPVRQSIGNN